MSSKTEQPTVDARNAPAGAPDTTIGPRHVVVIAAFEATADRPFVVGEPVRLSQLGDPELAVTASAVADHTGDVVMLAHPDRVPAGWFPHGEDDES